MADEGGAGAEKGRVRAACLEWTDPLMGCGSWIPQLIDIAGGDPLFASPGAKVRPGA